MSDSGKNVDNGRESSSILCHELGPIEWLDWKHCLCGDDLAVFRFYFSENTPRLPDWRALLHPDEIERAGRYHRRADRLRSLYTRSLLRILAGKYTHRNSLDIRLTAGSRQKPELADNPEWHVNAAHSGNWILLTVGRTSVGIDVEEIKPDFDFTDVISFTFSTQEQQYIGIGGNALRRFYALWTRKEAFVKAVGSGIDETFAQVPSLPGLHAWAFTQPAAAEAWKVASFHAAEGYPAAIAYHDTPKPLRFYTLDPGIFSAPNLNHA